MTSSDSVIESNPAVGGMPALVFVMIGLFIISIAAGVFVFFDGMDMTDEWTSRNWPEIEVQGIDQDLNADRDEAIFSYNYTVDDVEYSATFSCFVSMNDGTSDGSRPDPWETLCLEDSTYFLNLESVAYNPQDPSEIDVYPGFTFRVIFEHYLPKLSVPIVFIVIGMVVLLRGVIGPSFLPWAIIQGKINEIKEQMADENK